MRPRVYRYEGMDTVARCASCSRPEATPPLPPPFATNAYLSKLAFTHILGEVVLIALYRFTVLHTRGCEADVL